MVAICPPVGSDAPAAPAPTCVLGMLAQLRRLVKTGSLSFSSFFSPVRRVVRLPPPTLAAATFVHRWLGGSLAHRHRHLGRAPAVALHWWQSSAHGPAERIRMARSFVSRKGWQRVNNDLCAPPPEPFPLVTELCVQCRHAACLKLEPRSASSPAHA
jgi:hypothetical protein